MASSLGSLVVSIGLDSASFTSGLTKAEYQAAQFAQKLGRGIENAATLAIGSLGAIAAAGGAAFAFLDRQAESIAKFQELSDKIGDTAENIASLKAASDLSGVAFDTIAAASIRLTASLSKIDDEGKGAGAALAAIDLDLENFKSLSPVAQIEATAKALATFEDGAEKTAVAVALFGKSGADLLPLMQDLAGEAQRQATLTEEQIQAADAYTKQTAKLRGELENLAQQTTAALVPALSNIVTMMSDVIRFTKESEVGFTLLQASLSAVTTVIQTVIVVGSDVAFVLKGVGNEIGGIAAQIAALLRLDFKGFSAIGDAMKEDAKRARAELDKFQDGILNPQQKVASVAQSPVTRPRIDTRGLITRAGGGAGSGDNPAKAILDNQLKALENAANEERDILASRNKMLDLYNGAALISTQDYYAGRRAAQEEAVAAQAALYDKEIAALQAFQAKAGKATEREATQGKINDLIAKKAKLYRDAGEAAIEMGFREQKAAEDLARQLNSVNAEVLELTGNLSAAARLRVGDQFSEITKRLEANGDTAGLAQVNRLKELKIAQADYGQQAERVGQITESLRIQEERIQLSRQLGADSELSSLVKLREARTAAVSQMSAMVQAQEAIAKASGNPALIQNAERARLELDKLAATADPLADKFNNLIGEAGSNAFTDFVTGAKTAEEAMKSFGDTVANALIKMASEALFKDLAGGLLGGGSGGSAGSIGALLSSLFGAAGGGILMPGEMRRVNENGPELLDVNGRQYLMNGGRNARVTSNSKIGGGGDSNIYVTVPGNTDSRTALQIADKSALRQRQARRYA